MGLGRRMLRPAAAVAAAGLAVVGGACVANTSPTLRHRPAHEAPPSSSHRASEPTELAGAYAEDGIEILVHNLCHADLLVILSGVAGDGGSGADSRKARPLFNQYNFVSKVILGHLDALEAGGAKLLPIGAASSSGEVHPIGIRLTSDEVVGGAAIVDGDQSTAGGGMEGAAISSPWERFHLKGVKRHDRRPGSFKRLRTHPSGIEPPRHEEGEEEPMHDVHISAAVLPLVATLIPEWARAVERLRQKRLSRSSVDSSTTRKPKKILVLVSGSGQPRDPHADPQDNSTSLTSLIVGRFVNLCYPEIQVIHVSSTGGMFRYDDNLAFVQHRVLPIIERLRKSVVAVHGEDWASFLNITLSLSDGAPARMAALNASLRPYRPNYLHLWRLKTWWDEDRLCERDVDFHAFHKLEMRPALPRAELVGDDRRIVDEMLKYRAQFEAVRDGSHAHGGEAPSGHSADELSSFWLRKSRKAVLAVLLTRKAEADAAPVIYRGMNLEVSMPTGTLCAERNAIGNALANDQSLRREDIRAIAVLSVSIARREDGENSQQARADETTTDKGETLLNPLDPCGACMEWLRKIAEVNPDFKVITFNDTTCESAIITPIEYLTV